MVLTLSATFFQTGVEVVTSVLTHWGTMCINESESVKLHMNCKITQSNPSIYREPATCPRSHNKSGKKKNNEGLEARGFASQLLSHSISCSLQSRHPWVHENPRWVYPGFLYTFFILSEYLFPKQGLQTTLV